jgi:hypothetical protein
MIEIVLTAALAVVQSAEPAKPAAQKRERAPRETVSAMVGGKKVSIDYGRPALNGRKMSDLLVQLPADRIWRAGENQATTFTTETDVIIGGKRVKAGKYTLYVHAPATGDYSLVLNTDVGVPLKTIFPGASPEMADALWPRLGDYETVKAKEVLRVPLKKSVAATPSDLFQIALAPAKNGESAITLTWGDESWTTDIKPTVVPVGDAADGDVPVLEHATATVGGRKVDVAYARPSLHGRTLDQMLGMINADRMWRAGYHFPTTLTTAGDLMVGGRRLPAGTYTVFVHVPETGAYSLVLNSNRAVPEEYARVAATEVLRVPMARGTAAAPEDRFLVSLRPAAAGASTLAMTWGDPSWNIDLRAASPSR